MGRVDGGGGQRGIALGDACFEEGVDIVGGEGGAVVAGEEGGGFALLQAVARQA